MTLPNPHALLVGRQISVATMDNGLEAPQENEK